MIYLLLGKDDFSKKEFISELVAKNKLEVFDAVEGDSAEILQQVINDSNLFGGKKLIKIWNFFGAATETESFLEKIENSENIAIFLEEKLDKRKTETKKLLANKNIKLLEFEIPSGAEFKNWLLQRAKHYDLKISVAAMNLLLQRLGVEMDNQAFGASPLYDLWQADSELKKLKTFAGDSEVQAGDVTELVAENIDDNVFKITNAIGERNKKLTVKYMTDYMDRLGGTDEKTKVIGLSALISDQFRNILMIQDLANSRSDTEIAATSGFTSGRVFIYKKLARNFTSQKIQETLKKLELLDQEIKTSNSPASLQFFMIIDSAMK